MLVLIIVSIVVIVTGIYVNKASLRYQREEEAKTEEQQNDDWMDRQW